MANINPSPSFEINGVSAAIYLGESGDSGGIVEQITDRGLEITIEFLVRWSDRVAFYQGLRGSAGVDADKAIVRQDPWSLPVNPDDLLPNLEPYGEDSPYHWENYICIGTGPCRPQKPIVDKDGSVTGLAGWVYYSYAIIPATFAVAPYQIVNTAGNGNYELGRDLSGYPYTSIKGKANGEVFQADVGSYVFKNQGTPVDSAGFIRSRQEFTITRHLMPYLDTSAYEAMIGRLNEKAITIGTTKYQPESILYMGYEPEWVGDPSTGLLFCNIHHTVMANGVFTDSKGNSTTSWNYAITPNGVIDQMVLQKDMKTTPYLLVDDANGKGFIATIWPETVGGW